MRGVIMRRLIYKITQILLLIITFAFILKSPEVQAQDPYGDLTPDLVSFAGRRGAVHTVSWDRDTYEVTFATPDGTFVWDWIGFVGQAGSVALNGYPDVGNTFAMSDASALTGAQPGDLIRIKGRGVLGLAHLTKLGLVIGSGAQAQRAWLSEGDIQEYTVAPDYVGYRVEVLGRTAEVRVTSLNPYAYYSVAAIEVTLDDATNARVILASDLEPVADYAYAVEFRSRTDTQVIFDSGNQAIRGTQGSSGYPVYVYSDQALESWSGHNLSFGQYLAADTLDEQVYGGSSSR